MRHIHRDIVSALLFSKDGKFIQGRRNPKEGGVYSDCWQIPGGGMKPGEDERMTLNREIKEELGLDISSYHATLINTTTGSSEKTLKDTGEHVICDMSFHDYRVVIDDRTANEITISLDDDLAEYRWSTIEDLKTLKITPPSIELFTKLGYL